MNPCLHPTSFPLAAPAPPFPHNHARYDPFNRLVGSNQNSGQAVYSYAYDRFGNRWQQNGPNSMQLTFTGNNQSSPQNNNRMDGYSYDAAGNLLNDGTHQYFYDAENHLIQVDGTLPYCSSNGASGTAATACYFYDANGHRVRSTGVNCYGSGITGGVGYLYDLSGREITTFAMSTTGGGGPCQYEVFAGGRHLAQVSGAVVYSHVDWLGTERVRTSNSDSSTWTLCESIASLPFGDGQVTTPYPNNGYPTGCYNTSPLHFTGKERDSESGLDNFGARYNASSFGRFMSPDWSDGLQPIPYADLKNPQSLNLYGYADNNPLSKRDEDGHEPCIVDGEKHGSTWCWFHKHHLFGVETAAERQADRVKDARRFIQANGFDLIKVNGHWQPSSSSNDGDIASWWKDYNDSYRNNLDQGMSAAGAFGIGRGGGGRLTNAQANDLAKWSGMEPVKDPPFDPHGQKVFRIGNRYFSPDADSHIGGVWKEFDRQGNRVATLDVYLNKVGE